MTNQNNETKPKKENLSLRNDYFFKRVFAKDGNESILKDFLEAILQIPIETVVVKNPEIPKDMLNSKIGVLDVKAKINNGPMVDIEMQMVDQKNIDKRTATYLSKEYGMQLKEGEEYSRTSKVITVNILNFEYYKRNSYHSVAHMRFEKTEKDNYVDMGYEKEDEIAIEDFEVHFIELPKFIKKNPSGKRKLDQWLWLLIGREEKIEMAEKENEEIKKAKQEIEVLSQDETERYIYELRQKAIRDEKNIRESGYEDGLEAGRKEREQEIYELRQKAIRDEKNIRESGYEDGLEAGRKEREQEIYELRQKAIRDEKNIRESGYEDGLEAGRKEREQEIYELRQKAIRDEKNIRESGYEDGLEVGRKETAKKMLEEGIEIEKIIRITGLTQEEIMS